MSVSYKYVHHETMKPPPVEDDTVLYQWALKKWSECSQPCGAGNTHTHARTRQTHTYIHTHTAVDPVEQVTLTRTNAQTHTHALL